MSAKNNVQNGVSSRGEAKILLIYSYLLAAAFFILPGQSISAGDDWSGIEEEMALEQRALEVNEGELQLLVKPPGGVAHFHQNRLMLTEQSLLDGWVTMYQCHSDMDKVAASQIVYDRDSIRDIKVLSTRNIGTVRVVKHTVQMEDIKTESKICISADKRALSREGGLYYLRLGPFMRRFLDGYYPMHVQVEVCYPAFLELVSASPVKAIKYSTKKRSHAEIDLWVVGRLEIELVFRNRLEKDQ